MKIVLSETDFVLAARFCLFIQDFFITSITDFFLPFIAPPPLIYVIYKQHSY